MNFPPYALEPPNTRLRDNGKYGLLHTSAGVSLISTTTTYDQRASVYLAQITLTVAMSETDSSRPEYIRESAGDYAFRAYQRPTRKLDSAVQLTINGIPACVVPNGSGRMVGHPDTI